MLQNIISEVVGIQVISKKKISIFTPLIEKYVNGEEQQIFTNGSFKSWAQNLQPFSPLCLSPSSPLSPTVVHPQTEIVSKSRKFKKRGRKSITKLEAETRNKGLSTPLSSGPGFNLMMKWGWSPGESTGKDNRGRLEPVPIIYKSKKQKQGLGMGKSKKRFC